jgi:predicted transcriptional regulator
MSLKRKQKKYLDMLSKKLTHKELFDKLLILASEYFNIKKTAIVSKIQARKNVDVRSIIASLLHEQGLSYLQIAELLNKDHSTIIYYVNRVLTINELEKEYNNFKAYVQNYFEDKLDYLSGFIKLSENVFVKVDSIVAITEYENKTKVIINTGHEFITDIAINKLLDIITDYKINSKD